MIVNECSECRSYKYLPLNGTCKSCLTDDIDVLYTEILNSSRDVGIHVKHDKPLNVDLSKYDVQSQTTNCDGEYSKFTMIIENGAFPNGSFV